MAKRYQVYKTDADDSMEPGNLVFDSGSFDIAETVMVNLYKMCTGTIDFLVVDSTEGVIPAFCLTYATAFKKGLCQQ